MLKTALIHPDLIALLSLCGHGDQVLIADANYPLDRMSGDAGKVWLGVTPGLPTATQVLDAVLTAVNVERAAVMQPEDGSTPEIFPEFRQALGGMTLEPLGRYEFYDACVQPAVRVAVATGEKRVYANILLTIGVA